MPSTVIASGRDGPVVKRQKLNGVGDAPRSIVRESRIFTPFRVRRTDFLVAKKAMKLIDYRPLV